MNNVFVTEHSVYLDSYNTRVDFHLMPTKRPFIAPKEPRTNFVEVTGMNGVLDYTTVLTGSILYDNISGSWEFILIPDEGYTVTDLRNDLYEKVDGKYFTRIMLEDDQDHYYEGRVTLDSFSEGDDGLKVTLKYSLKPERHNADDNNVQPISHGTRYFTWQWDNLFSTNLIYYGMFTVNGEKRRTLVNNLGREVGVNSLCTSSFNVTLQNRSIVTLPFGYTANAFYIQHGNTIIDISGDGDIQFDYEIR